MKRLVNDIALRGNADVVKYAEREVVRARKNVENAESAIETYRKENQVIDPTTSVVQANIALMGSLRITIMQMETQANALADQSLSPTAPVAADLASRIAAAKAELKRVEGEIRASREGSGAISVVVGKYETLDLERTYANTAYFNAMLALDQARANMNAQHIYLTPYSAPTMPESPLGPSRIANTFISFLIFSFFWLVGLLLYRTLTEGLTRS